MTADLLSTREVQDFLQVDRTTIYRLVEGGQLPAIRVGKQWRFSRADLERWLRAQAGPNVLQASGHPAPIAPLPEGAAFAPPDAAVADLASMPWIQMMQDMLAEALGVMIVVTDMVGQPQTRVSNTCGLYEAVMKTDDAVTRCIEDWQRMAAALSLEPRFAPGSLGLLCAHGLIRLGRELGGMVFLGGVAPEGWPPDQQETNAIAEHFGVAPERITGRVNDVHRLDSAGQERALGFVQRFADMISQILDDRNRLRARLQAIASLTAL